MSDEDYYSLSDDFTDPKRIQKERDKARKLKKTHWWLNLINQGVCHYCQVRFAAKELTLDHIIPLARGGTSTPGNIVPACKKCNLNKKLHTPVDLILKQMKEKE